MSPPQQAPDASSARKALVAWMRASGFWWDEARLDLEGGGRGDARGVCAVAAIAAPAMPPTQLAAAAAKAEAADEPPPEPSALAVMPLARLLTWRTTWARQAVAVAMEQRERAGEGAAAGAWVMPVAFALLAERSVADESEWAPYLAALPAAADVPWRWSKDDAAALLSGTDAEALCAAIRAEARREWEAFVTPAVRQLRDKPGELGGTSRGAALAEEAHWTLDKYMMARSLVTSRAFNLPAPDGAGLVPGADLFNHAAPGAHSVDFAEGAAGYRLETDDGVPVECVCVAAARAAAAGEELFLTYGALPPAELLCHFAFVTEAPPRDEDAAASVSLGELRAAVALKGGVTLTAANGDAAGEYAVLGGGAPSEALVLAAEAACGGDAGAARRAMAGAARRRLARLEAGERAFGGWAGGAGGGRKEAAKRLRAHERRALQALLSASEADGMDATGEAGAKAGGDAEAWALFS